MGRLDLRDPRRDEDDEPRPLVQAWKKAVDLGISDQFADRIIDREQGEIPPRLVLALRGIKTQPPRQLRKTA